VRNDTLLRATSCDFRNKGSESSAKYAQALRHDPDLPEIRLYLAAQFAHEARYHEARKNVDTILMHLTLLSKARFVRAISAFETGDTADLPFSRSTMK